MLVVVEAKAFQILEKLEDDIPCRPGVVDGNLQFLSRSAQCGVADSILIQLVIGDPLGQLPQHLAPQVFRNLPELIDLSKRLGDGEEFLLQQQEDLSLDRIDGHKVVDLRRVLLAVTMDTPDALFDVHRIPRQVVVEQDTRELQVDPLASRRRADQHARAVAPLEPTFRRNLGAVIPALQYLHARAGEALANGGSQRGHAAEIGRKDDDLLVGMHGPEFAEAPQKFLCLSLVAQRQLFQ